jgi:hypothetical protein
MKIALLALVLSACALDEVDLGETSQDVTTTNKLATNKLASNKLATNKLAAAKLATASFVSGTLAQPLLETVDGRDVLTYLVACALSSTQSVTFTSAAGTAYTFHGEIGLATAWNTRALTVDEQRWTSACVLARTNYYGVPVNLSMRGYNTALKTTSADMTYTGLDGVFYGNLFDTTGVKEYACDGKTTNTQRICADPDPATGGTQTMCGFSATGACGPAAGGACDFYAGKCRITLTGPIGPTAYTQAIAVYLQP